MREEATATVAIFSLSLGSTITQTLINSYSAMETLQSLKSDRQKGDRGAAEHNGTQRVKSQGESDGDGGRKGGEKRAVD